MAKALYGFQAGRIFCANSPSQQASRALYNLLLLLRKNGLFYHRSEGYGPPSSSVRLKSIRSLGKVDPVLFSFMDDQPLYHLCIYHYQIRVVPDVS